MNNNSIRELELLAPAKDLHTACEAIIHGADAVYIGAPSHGARSKAANSLDDIRQLVSFASPFGVKVYVTVNTIIYEDELPAVRDMIAGLYRIGADALIVQDMGILEMEIPPIALHASTQCDTRTPEKARMLADAGFSQIVVARELSVDELRQICSSVDVPVEVFVHGALCVSYSGDCQASFLNNGRSANRGNCAQMCRLPYDLIDGDGNVIGRQRHYLSLRDLNRVADLSVMAEAGVSSFKIEGRLKDASYVKNVTAAYRQALDSLIEANPDKYRRSSRGITSLGFTPDLSRSFNRGFTSYFLRPQQLGHMATFDSPKALGEPVGKVISAKGNAITVSLMQAIANGDGLSYLTPEGRSGGFRVNRAEPGRIFTLDAVTLPPETRLFRSFDKQWEDKLAKPTAIRQIPIDITLREITGGRVAADGQIDGMRPVTVTCQASLTAARQPDNGYRRKTLAKLGNTPFVLRNLDDRLEYLFMPASCLSEIRRSLTDAMLHTLSATKTREMRRKAETSLTLTSTHITRHDNVANSLAERFYRRNGAKRIDHAIEVQPTGGDTVVMTTRYCLRRELGACLKENGNRLKGQLWLKGADFKYKLDFDCKSCLMKVIYQQKS